MTKAFQLPTLANRLTKSQVSKSGFQLLKQLKLIFMNNKTLLPLFVFVLLMNSETKSQSSFEIHYALPGFQLVRNIFEVENNNYVAICNSGYDDNLPIQNTFFLKFSDENNINEYAIQKQDTITNITKGFAKENGNYLLMGSVRDTLSTSSNLKLYICEVTEGFSIVWEKMYDVPEEHKTLRIIDYRIGDNGVLTIEGHFRPIDEKYTDPYLFFVKLSMEGEMLGHNYQTEYQSILTGENLIIKPDENGYYLFGQVKDSLGWSFDWLSIDTNLNIIDRGNFYGIWNFFGEYVTVRKLSNNNLLYISINGGSFYYDVIDVRISDMDLDFMADTMLIRQDTNMYPGSYNGMDFITEDEIFIVGFTPGFMFLPGTNDYKIYVLDSELNYKGAKVYGGETRYSITDIVATSDGGCLVAGVVPDFEGSYDYVVYIRKIESGDIYTYAEETIDPNDRDVSVWPNPFGDHIIVQTLRKGLKFLLFDEKGKMVLQTDILSNQPNSINSGAIPNGAYVYKVFSIEGDKLVQTGKLIKQ